MPSVGSLEQYHSLIAASNVGYQSLWLIVGLLLLVMVRLAPYVRRHHIFYAVVAVGICARISIMARSTWYDEAFTAAVVRAPDFWGAILGDVHPPLAYVVIKLFSLFAGTSEIALRVPSLIASIALIYAVYRLAWDYTGEITTAQTAAGLVALMGAPISYAAEARHPAMLALAVIVSMIGLAERRQWLFVVGAIVAAYLHAIGSIYVGVFVLMAWWRWPKAALIVMMLSSLWIPAMTYQQSQVADGFWLEAQSPLKHVVEMTLFTQDGLDPNVTGLTYAIVIGWTLVGVYMSRDWLVKRGGVWGVVAVGVPLLIGLISVVWHPIYLSRALLAPALLLVIAWAHAWPRLHWVFRGLLIIAVASSWCGVILIPSGPRKIPDIKTVFTHCAGADYVYATSTNIAIQAMVYAPAPVLVWRDGNNIDQQLSPDTKSAFGMFTITSSQQLPEHAEICLIALVSHRTTPEEKAEVERIRRDHTLIQDETLSSDQFYAYQLMRWNQ